MSDEDVEVARERSARWLKLADTLADSDGEALEAAAEDAMTTLSFAAGLMLGQAHRIRELEAELDKARQDLSRLAYGPR